jgi:hypothetical protein
VRKGPTAAPSTASPRQHTTAAEDWSHIFASEPLHGTNLLTSKTLFRPYSSGPASFIWCSDLGGGPTRISCLHTHCRSGLQSVVPTVKVEERGSCLSVVEFYRLHLAKEHAVSAFANGINHLAIERH